MSSTEELEWLLIALPTHRERTEAVTIEVQSPSIEDTPAFSFPGPSASTSSAADVQPNAEAAAQKVTPWDVQGATVEGKQVSTSD